jgi:hypothetical protein
MNALAEKAEIIQWITNLEDNSTILELRKIKEKFDLNSPLNSEVLSTFEKESILRGLNDSKNGKIIPHEEVKKKYAKFL